MRASGGPAGSPAGRPRQKRTPDSRTSGAGRVSGSVAAPCRQRRQRMGGSGTDPAFWPTAPSARSAAAPRASAPFSWRWARQLAPRRAALVGNHRFSCMTVLQTAVPPSTRQFAVMSCLPPATRSRSASDSSPSAAAYGIDHVNGVRRVSNGLDRHRAQLGVQLLLDRALRVAQEGRTILRVLRSELADEVLDLAARHLFRHGVSLFLLSRISGLVSGRPSVGHGLSKSNRGANDANRAIANEISLVLKVWRVHVRQLLGPGLHLPGPRLQPSASASARCGGRAWASCRRSAPCGRRHRSTRTTRPRGARPAAPDHRR